jgi:DNA-binding NtrC family response regulator
VALVVDDDRAVSASVGAILERDHDVITAVDVTTALDVARSQPVDVVRLDIAMSAGDDLEISPLKALSPRVEVTLVVSSLIDALTVVRGMRLGAADFSTKPFDRPRCARWWRSR